MSNGECGNKNFNDRVISSNALKEALIAYCENCDKSNPYRCEHCLTNVFEKMIDNAPTVFDCRSCKNNGNERECVDCHDYSNYVRYEERPQCNQIAWEQGYEAGLAQGKQDRPQGEWTNKHFEHADCSLCGRRNDYHGDFCKYCGADMRKGGKE